MSLRKWNDDKGWSRGAKGIDDEKGVGWVERSRDTEAEKHMFGRAWDFDGKAKPANPNEYSGKKDTKKYYESPDYDTK